MRSTDAIDVRYVLAGLFAFLLVSSGAFAVQPGSGRDLSPVAFEETITVGLTGVDVQRARAAGYDVPRAEVFYSQYEYVVGYYGVETLASELARESTERQFGRPFAVFVTDYADGDPRLTERGYVLLKPGTATGWVAAEEASFVVDSGARTPAGPATLPFSSRSAARDFAAEYGGSVVGWAEARRRLAGEGDTAGYAAEQVRNRSAWADGRVAAADSLLDRPVSVVVGEGAPTVAAAVETAPPNTTVRVPPGTYDVNLTVEKPLTIRGAGEATHLRGNGNGTVIRLFAPRSALGGVRITGVGPNGTAQAVPNRSREDWDARVLAAYGYGDAAVALDSADRSVVSDVAIETPSNGVIVRSSPGAVVRDLDLDGSDDWRTGFMGVVAMRSRIVVQNSTFEGGRDGVYTHRAHGMVVRDSAMSDMRFGVHEMYTSSALVVNNTVRRTNVGVIVMTRPTGNALVGNDVRDSRGGLSATGSAAYVAENVLADNDVGLYVNGQRTRYARNSIVGNDVGVRADTILPTNRVVENDVVGNGESVSARRGPVRVWSADGRGNYWGPLPALDGDGDGVYEREFRPTGPVDGRVHEAPGAAVLARSPTLDLLRALGNAVPGLRAAGVVDEAPLAGPIHPDALERLAANRTDDDPRGPGLADLRRPRPATRSGRSSGVNTASHARTRPGAHTTTHTGAHAGTDLGTRGNANLEAPTGTHAGTNT